MCYIVLYGNCTKVWSVRCFRTSLKDPVRARKAFKDAQGAHLALDYPEAVYEAWIAFEEIWGTSKDLEYALGRVRKMAAVLNDKRSKVSVFRFSLGVYQRPSIPK